MTLENLIGKGLQREPASAEEIHRFLALQTLNTSIGYPREKLRLLDEYRRQRGIGLYDGSFVPTQAEFDGLLATTMELKAYLETWLNKHHPALP